MLTRLEELATQRSSFAFETTLASRSFAPWISNLKQTGYVFHVIYIWLPSANVAISRVQQRVQQKGHHVPDDVVSRRRQRGIENFFELLQPIADTWRMYQNLDGLNPRLIARGGFDLEDEINNAEVWEAVMAGAQHGT